MKFEFENIALFALFSSVYLYSLIGSNIIFSIIKTSNAWKNNNPLIFSFVPVSTSKILTFFYLLILTPIWPLFLFCIFALEGKKKNV